MKYLLTAALLFCTMFIARAQVSAGVPVSAATAAPWKASELMEPGQLNEYIKINQAPVIFNTGTVEDIKGAIHIGSINEAANLEKFKLALASRPKNTEVVIYCGCCPFGKCPNIRPAYKQLKDLGYTNVKVLNLYVNLRNNWTSEGYPLAKD